MSLCKRVHSMKKIRCVLVFYFIFSTITGEGKDMKPPFGNV